MTLRGVLMIGASVLALSACKATRDTAVSAAIPVHAYGASAGNGSLGFHTVHTGETVWTISQRYGLVLRDVLDANHLSPPYELPKGARLTLPAPQTYSTRDGDSLVTIARMFNTSESELARLNNLSAPYQLRAGQSLKLPAAFEAPPPAPAVQPVVYRPEKIESETLSAPSGPSSPPPKVAVQQGGYIPPASNPGEYEDTPAKVQQAAAPVEAAKVIGKPPAREGKFIKPVAGKVISGYGPKPDGLHNDGINIQAARGDAVRAAESGVVVYTGSQIEGYGNLILVRHADQYVTAYAHLDKALVKKGDKVKRGQAIGTVGATGAVDKPQLHFEIRKGTKALNPAGMI